MRTNETDHSQIKQYLFGQLAEPDKVTFEEDYFLKPGVLRELEMAEEELIDDYLNQDLDAEERRYFEQFFLSTHDKKQKLIFAETLQKQISKKAGLLDWISKRINVPSTLLMRLALGTVAASLVISGELGWQLLAQQSRQVGPFRAENRAGKEARIQLTVQLQEAEATNNELANRLDLGARFAEGLEGQIRVLKTQLSAVKGIPQQVVSFLLQVSVLRSGGETRQVNLPKGARIPEVRLVLDLAAEGYDSYQVELSRLGGVSLPSIQNLQAGREGDQTTVVATWPADQFASGD